MKNELNAYLEAIKKDYLKMEGPATGNIIKNQVRNKMIYDFFNGLRIEEGNVYFKVISGNDVHSFIVRNDGPKFKRGDILKAASWRAPAKNQARGNIFGQYHVSWTGADYLR